MTTDGLYLGVSLKNTAAPNYIRGYRCHVGMSGGGAEGGKAMRS